MAHTLTWLPRKGLLLNIDCLRFSESSCSNNNPNPRGRGHKWLTHSFALVWLPGKGLRLYTDIDCLRFSEASCSNNNPNPRG